ncbi:hypothetical protein F8M41_021799 [Gigaspora margarita]|uniref:Uncharacterized protein n=1 Tax=Gigaspora margarita TaxID=4874 RepID=A0A8H4AG49_GIGMA|nr:hypothetical protein F8M41_021799 [Gigaspora margarita]
MLKLFTNAIKKKNSQDINESKDTSKYPVSPTNVSDNYVPEVENTNSNETNKTNSYRKNKSILIDNETTTLTEKAGGTSERKHPISIRKEKSISGVFQPELTSPFKPSRLCGSPESYSKLSEFLSSSVHQSSLTYLVVRKNSSLSSDIEILYPIDNAKVGETTKGSDQEHSQNYEIDPIYHTIYSKHIIPSRTSLYHSVLKQIYNDFTILEARQVSLAGEPAITIKSFIGEDTELRRTGSISNTWHFEFEGKDYRWRPSVLGAKGCDLICEWIEYEVQSSLIGTAKKKNKVIIASLKRPEQITRDNWDVIGDLNITKTAWENVKDPRSLEIILVLGCLIMLDVT